MTNRFRNVITGFVVLLAGVAFVWMLLELTGRATAAFAKRGIPIYIRADRCDGVNDGTIVTFHGIEVGTVRGIGRDADNVHVSIRAEVHTSPPLPANLEGVMRLQSMLSSSPVVSLELKGPPEGQLAPDAHLEGRFVGSQILPPELTDFITDFRRQKLIEHTDEAILALRTQIENAGEVLKSVQTVIGDPKLQADLKQAITNVRTATERADVIGANLEKFTSDLQNVQTDFHEVAQNANQTVTSMRTVVEKTGNHVDDVSRHLIDDMDKLGKSLDQFQAMAAKINNGDGTAGRLLNDPRLYDQLSDTAKELNAVAASIHRLIDQWEQEGLHLKLK
jgi:phospholipid/cholesterol/gamma-HCH transport system substrate-binding protein